MRTVEGEGKGNVNRNLLHNSKALLPVSLDGIRIQPWPWLLQHTATVAAYELAV